MKKLTLTVVAVSALAAVAAQPAFARTTTNTKDGKPNILVVMTDDEAVSDLQAMPNLKSLVASQGATFNNMVDSFPLCCPSRATFITGQYAHNHGVGGNFWPYGWYGMANRNNTLPVWLKSAGYYTAAVGKWLNGYGAGNQPGTKNPGDPLDTDINGTPLVANGEIPAGFDNWNGAIDVSAYDYFNLALNQNGKINYWGDKTYSQNLNKFAEIQVSTRPKSFVEVVGWSNKFFGPFSSVDPSTYGSQVASDYSPDVTANVSNSIVKAQATNKTKPFFLWWSPAATHREDVDGGVRNGYRDGVHYYAKSTNKHIEDKTKLVPDPRPAPRYASLKWDWSKITSKPNYDAAPTDKPAAQQSLLASSLNSVSARSGITTAARLQADYNGRLGAAKAVDDGIKKLVATLKSTKQWSNTIIMFTSDNGWLQGEHRVPGDKYLPFEESIRVPFIIAGPGIPKGRVVNTLVSNIDFAPTIMDAAKGTAGRTMDGVSLLSGAKGTAAIPSYSIGLEANAPLFADASMPQQWDQPYRGVRTDRWKFVVWCQKNDPVEARDVQTCTPTGEQELYDLQTDPYELNNLASNSTYASVKAGLATKLNSLSSCVGTACRIGQ